MPQCISYNPLGWLKICLWRAWLLIVSITWHLNESHAKIRQMNEKFPRTLLNRSKVSSSFILPLEDDATTHLALNSSFSNLVSLLVLGKTIKGFHFVQSAFALRQTETFVFSWPVVFMAIVLWPMESTVVLESMSHKTAVSSSAIGGSEWGLVFSVICLSFLVFTLYFYNVYCS